MPRLSLRERKKQKIRQDLIRISTQLFLQHGYDQTTVEDIVKQADVSQRTFFRYFPNKEDLVFRDKPQRLQRFQEVLDKAQAASTPLTSAKVAILQLARDTMKNQQTLKIEYDIVTASPYLLALDVEQDMTYQRLMASALERHPAGALDRFKANLLSGAIFGAIRSIMEDWYENDCQQNLLELGTECLRMIDALESY